MHGKDIVQEAGILQCFGAQQAAGRGVQSHCHNRTLEGPVVPNPQEMPVGSTNEASEEAADSETLAPVIAIRSLRLRGPHQPVNHLVNRPSVRHFFDLEIPAEAHTTQLRIVRGPEDTEA